MKSFILKHFTFNHRPRIEKALKKVAEVSSDAEYHRVMANFWTERVLDLDPHTDWWEFAEAKEKQHEHQISYGRFTEHVLPKKQAELDARLAKAAKQGAR